MATAIQNSNTAAHMMGAKRPREDDYEEEFNVGSHRDDVKVEAKDTRSPMEQLFGDPEKMLHLWLLGEGKPNPFADNSKDPMESFGKFVQSILMQTQTGALSDLRNTMTRNQQFAAASLMGEVVEVESDSMTISPGKRISETFTVPEEADAFAIKITNAEGELVYQDISYNPGIGVNKFEWPGTDNEGNELPSGEYSVTVELLTKVEHDGSPPSFEHLEYARSLDLSEINDKRETLSAVDREVQFSYEMPEGIAGLEHASVWITNSKGTAVHKGEIDVKPGERGVYSWNGQDRTGKRVPEDEYRITVNFKDGQKKMIKTDEKAVIRVSGQVHGVELNEAGEPNVITSRIKAPLSSIKRVANENAL